ncbi:MAG TPA: hypothetical protein VMB26_00050, partial [Candidatus Binataceae bacterium]|nr:hypothetical protein [Candidatus Binataceae bacterium]
PNPLIDALFDADRIVERFDDLREAVDAHASAFEIMVRNESNGDRLAASSVLLAVSLGHAPQDGMWLQTSELSVTSESSD